MAIASLGGWNQQNKMASREHLEQMKFELLVQLTDTIILKVQHKAFQELHNFK